MKSETGERGASLWSFAAKGHRGPCYTRFGGLPVYQITLEIRRLEEGPYLGTSPELPGLIVQAATPEEVVDLAPDVARDLIAVMVETGQELPTGLRPLDFPGRVPIVVLT